MKNNHSRINFFREAAPYINLHRGKTFVVAFPGKVIDDQYFDSLTNDIATLSALGGRIILVHGARLQIDQHLQQRNYPIDINNDLRITDAKTLDIVKETIGALRVEIENKLSHALSRPPIINDGLGVLSGNFITAKPAGVFNGIDYQYTGKVRKVNTLLIQTLLAQENIVLLSSLGFSPTGEAYNLRYEDVASFVATQIQADKLIFINQQQYNLPREIDRQDITDIIKKNPSLPILKDINNALNQGVKRVHLINDQQNGGLLLELYTRDGIGSMFTASLYDEIRQATIDDVSGIIELIAPLEEKGALIKRSREQLELEINNFTLIKRDGKVIGCAALYEMDDNETGELACLVTHADYRTGGRGDNLLKHISKLAKEKQLQRLLVLTTQSIDWFKERDFIMGEFDDLPDKKKTLYNFQRKSKVLFKPIT